MNEEANLGASMIVYAISQRREEVIDLLLRNGIVAPSGLTDFQLSQVVAELLKTSKNFKDEFMMFLIDTGVLEDSVSMSGYSNYTGFEPDKYNIFPESLFSKDKTTTTTSKDKTTTDDKSKDPKTGFTLDKALSLVDKGLNALITFDTNKTNRALADASIKNAEAGGGSVSDENKDDKPEKDSNTTLYVVLAILGIAVVGGGIWFAVKNKNN
jgi:hypothetical protein